MTLLQQGAGGGGDSQKRKDKTPRLHLGPGTSGADRDQTAAVAGQPRCASGDTTDDPVMCNWKPVVEKPGAAWALGWTIESPDLTPVSAEQEPRSWS